MLRLALLSALIAVAQAKLTLFAPPDNGTYSYGFAVHEPVGWKKSKASRPAAVFMHANTLLRYNGFGYLIDQYEKGNKTEPNKLAAEQFLTILPLSGLTPLDSSYNRYWSYPGVLDVLQRAAQHYEFDHRRIYLTGYSMGARGAWAVVLNNTQPWAAAGMVSGELNELQKNNAKAIEKVVRAQLPIRHYHASLDTNTSPLAQYKWTEAVFKKVAARLHLGNPLKGFIVNGVDHGGNQYFPIFGEDLLRWLLKQKRTSTPKLTTPVSVSH